MAAAKPTLESLLADIAASSAASGYLVCGEEDYLISVAERRLSRALLGVWRGPDDDRTPLPPGAWTLFENPVTAPGILKALGAPGLFARRQLVWVRGLPMLASKSPAADELVAALKRRAAAARGRQTALLIVHRGKVTRTLKAFKELAALYPTLSYDGLNPFSAGNPRKDESFSIVSGWFADAGFSADPEAFRRLRDLTENNLWALHNEVEKIIAHAAGRTRVTRADVDAVVAANRPERIFDLTERIDDGDLPGALASLSELRAANPSLTSTIAGLARHLRELLAARILGDALPRRVDAIPYEAFLDGVVPGLPEQFADLLRAELLGSLHPFRLYLLLQRAGRFAPEKISAALVALAELDRDLKSGARADLVRLSGIVVEMFGWTSRRRGSGRAP
ncbi:MAG: hypothetical protein HYV63_18340 [Candidatus Schekmanbacteria bacterium]|nr:hypothetical protein [Candidatus Schekmanbacteria bacterium]